MVNLLAICRQLSPGEENELQPVSVATVLQNMGCPAAPTPRMVVGELGRVVPGHGPMNRLQRKPTVDSQQIDSIAAGQEFTVLDGPISLKAMPSGVSISEEP